MKIVISNVAFDYNMGCRLLKNKHKNEPFKGLEDIWEHIVPYTFKEIATEIKNVEQRRIAIGCLGIDEVSREVNATLIKSETLEKQTTWVTPAGDIVEHKFKDTYELFKVAGNELLSGTDRSWGIDDVYYLRFKDTSTEREYLLWIDARDVAKTNNTKQWFSSEDMKHITPVQAIAWTFQTNVPAGQIEKIVRQGDCIMVKKLAGATLLDTPRHLTEVEYRNLLVAES